MNRRLPTAAMILAFCLLASAPVTAQLTGTLFTSPEQREYLDYLRQEFLARSAERGFDIDEAEIPEIPDAVAAAEEAVGPVLYTLGGIVSLRDGTQRIWLNGKALSEAELPREARLVRDNGMSVLRFSSANGTFLLRPGQTLELTAGTVVENYQRQVAELEVEAAPAPAEEVQVAQTEADTAETEISEQPANDDAVPEPAEAAPGGDTIQGLRNLLDALQTESGGSDG